MLSKILVTALIIGACYLLICFQRNRQSSQDQGVNSQNHRTEQTASTPFHWLAVGLLLLSLCAGVGFFIHDWLDSRTLLTVKVTNPYTGDSLVYQVYKGDLQEHSFETIQGQKVRIGDSERIEVSNTRQ